MLASEDKAFSHKINKSQAQRYLLQKLGLKTSWDNGESRTRDLIFLSTSKMRNQSPLGRNQIPINTLGRKEAKISCVSAGPDLMAICRVWEPLRSESC